jgi:GntR family transcriptional regulator
LKTSRPEDSRSPAPAAPSFRPLYEQIRILLTQSLVAGEWKPGEAIPPEHELAARFRVSQGTVRKAIDELAAESILVRRQGKGTFVASHSEPAWQYRFLRVMPDSGEKVHPANRFLEVRRGKADSAMARALEIKVGTPTVMVRRLLLFQGRPLILDEMVLAAAQVPGLTLARVDSYRGSMYSFYESVYGLRMIRAEERLRAVAADPASASLLAVAPGTALLCVDRIAFTYGDKPVEWRRGLCLTDGFSYFNELS